MSSEGLWQRIKPIGLNTSTILQKQLEKSEAKVIRKKLQETEEEKQLDQFEQCLDQKELIQKLVDEALEKRSKESRRDTPDPTRGKQTTRRSMLDLLNDPNTKEQLKYSSTQTRSKSFTSKQPMQEYSL